MIVVMILVLALLGGTTWLARNQPLAKHPILNQNLSLIELALCAAVFTAAGLAVAATWP